MIDPSGGLLYKIWNQYLYCKSRIILIHRTWYIIYMCTPAVTSGLVSWWSFIGTQIFQAIIHLDVRSLIHMLHLKAKAALRQGTPGRMPTEAQESQELQTVLDSFDSFDSFDPPNNNSTYKSLVCLMNCSLEVNFLKWINCCSFRNSNSPAAWSVEGWSRVPSPFLVCWSISCTSRCGRWFHQPSPTSAPSGTNSKASRPSAEWTLITGPELGSVHCIHHGLQMIKRSAPPGQNMWQDSTQKLELLWTVGYWSIMIMNDDS